MKLTMVAINKVAIRIATVSLTLIPQLTLAAEPYAVTIEHGVVAKMRDETVLRADIYRPTTTGKFPVILKRTPYDKHNVDAADFGVKGCVSWLCGDQSRCARTLHIRRWMVSLPARSNDGYDTIEWAAALPYANGTPACMGVRRSELHRCWQRLRAHRTSPEYVRS
jgi:predicted acyl esterase